MDELPPKRMDDTVITPLLDALAAATVDRNATVAFAAEVASKGFPATLPPIVSEGKIDDGRAGFVANIVCDPEQANQQFGALGFGLQLHLPNLVTLTEMRSELQRIVSSHDRPEIEYLLVTAGGPDREGIRYPAEELFAALLMQDQDCVVSAVHVRCVTLHLWSAAEVRQIDVERA
jgi:hypothetical protein